MEGGWDGQCTCLLSQWAPTHALSTLHHFPCFNTHAQAVAVTLTFGSSKPGVQGLVLTLLCVVFGYLHLIIVPLKHVGAQALQTTLLFCLTILALSGTPMAGLLERAASGVNVTMPSDRLARE